MTKRKPPTKTLLRIGDKVYIQDEEDSGYYDVSAIDEENDTCWLCADIPDEDDPDCTRSVEQEFPLSWIEEWFSGQEEEEWEKRKAKAVAREKPKKKVGKKE